MSRSNSGEENRTAAINENDGEEAKEEYEYLIPDEWSYYVRYGLASSLCHMNTKDNGKNDVISTIIKPTNNTEQASVIKVSEQAKSATIFPFLDNADLIFIIKKNEV